MTEFLTADQDVVKKQAEYSSAELIKKVSTNRENYIIAIKIKFERIHHCGVKKLGKPEGCELQKKNTPTNSERHGKYFQ